ncbi:MAG: hypothetical protein AAGB26_11615 [Planctomycetota bacterium]
MMNVREYKLKSEHGQSPKSLVWRDQELVDWVGGQVIYHLDGNVEPRRINYAYRFDNAIASASGRWALLFETLGTKGILLDQGNIVREINRSFYHASAYAFPGAFFVRPDGGEALLHCPKEYCQLDIEDLETGQCISELSERAPKDVFHGRLAISPGSSFVMSAGWVWHPADVVAVSNLRDCLNNPTKLDEIGWNNGFCDLDYDLWASFLDDNRYAVFALDQRIADAKESNDPKLKELRYAKTEEEEDEYPDAPMKVMIFDCETGQQLSSVVTEAIVGDMMPVGADYVLGLYEYPKLFELSSGRVVQSWPHITTGKHNRSISRQIPPAPRIAKDPENRRIAITQAEGTIEVLVFDEAR